MSNVQKGQMQFFHVCLPFRAEGELPPLDPFSGLWKWPICVPSSELTLLSMRALLKLLQPQDFKHPQSHLLVPAWALRGQAQVGTPWEGVDPPSSPSAQTFPAF